MTIDSSDSDTDVDSAVTSRCGATCRDGSLCQAYPVEGSDRCRMHGGQSPGGTGPPGNQNARRHGLHADPANVLDDLAENDPAAYEWVMQKYDSYLDAAPFDDGSAKADQLKQIAVQEYIIWRSTGLQLQDGVVVETNEPKGDRHGDTLKGHPVNQPLDRMQRTVTSRLKELGVLDDPASQKANATQSRVEALRELMREADRHE